MNIHNEFLKCTTGLNFSSGLKPFKFFYFNDLYWALNMGFCGIEINLIFVGIKVFINLLVKFDGLFVVFSLFFIQFCKISHFLKIISKQQIGVINIGNFYFYLEKRKFY